LYIIIKLILTMSGMSHDYKTMNKKNTYLMLIQITKIISQIFALQETLTGSDFSK